MMKYIEMIHDGKTTDGKLISRRGVEKVIADVNAALIDSEVGISSGMPIFLCPSNNNSRFRREAVGYIRGLVHSEDLKTLSLKADLFGAGAAFCSQPKRNAKFVFNGRCDIKQDRKWYMPWRKIEFIDSIDVNCILMTIITD